MQYELHQIDFVLLRILVDLLGASTIRSVRSHPKHGRTLLALTDICITSSCNLVLCIERACSCSN